ncbi:response regulator transcription factor [Paracoccaceae bacterium GXU_MW_L88]
MSLIAIVEDDEIIREMIVEALGDAGMETVDFASAARFEAALPDLAPDLCLMDLGLPDRDGLALIQKVTDRGVPVIIVSGRRELHDRVSGLDLGADDYITKPFEMPELVARIRAQLRRGRPQSAESGTRERAQFGGWTADFRDYSLTHEDGRLAQFSQAEGDVLRCFLASPKRLISRSQMQDQLGGAASEAFDRAVDVRISRLRGKLGDDPKNPTLIRTIYGAGYLFLADVRWL